MRGSEIEIVTGYEMQRGIGIGTGTKTVTKIERGTRIETEVKIGIIMSPETETVNPEKYTSMSLADIMNPTDPPDHLLPMTPT